MMDPKEIISGRIDNLPERPRKVVKIFLSSTFSDMYTERNYLMEHVHPGLQRYCRERHNVEFQVVDMRWGVRDEANIDHSGPKLCMEELKLCQKVSLGPNFVPPMVTCHFEMEMMVK